jgi:plastocyanin
VFCKIFIAEELPFLWMKLKKTGISTILAAALVAVVLVAAGGAYILYSQAGGMTGSSSNTSSQTVTTASSSSSSAAVAANVVMSIPASVILGSSDVVANYTMKVVVLGTLEAPLTLGAQAPNGVTVLFQPGSIQPNQQSTDVEVSIEVGSSAPSGSYSLNVTASGAGAMGNAGGSYAQSFSLRLVPYLVVTTGSSFVPNSINVPAGSTVYWIRLNGAIDQYDNGAHNVVFNDGMASSPTLAQYDTYTYTFNTQGTFGYRCTFHATMQGTVIVT